LTYELENAIFEALDDVTRLSNRSARTGMQPLETTGVRGMSKMESKRELAPVRGRFAAGEGRETHHPPSFVVC
jgi:hypothetical protein